MNLSWLTGKFEKKILELFPFLMLGLYPYVHLDVMTLWHILLRSTGIIWYSCQWFCRFCLAVDAIGFVYSGLQAYDLVYISARGKHLAQHRFRPYLDFSLDQASASHLEMDLFRSYPTFDWFSILGFCGWKNCFSVSYLIYVSGSF